jgi:hypothetical protein
MPINQKTEDRRVRKTLNSIEPRHFLLKVVVIIFTAGSAFSFVNAEEYVNNYTEKPKLKIYYGNHREKKFPIDVHEIQPVKVSDRSYSQEFELQITQMRGEGVHLFIGMYKGFRIIILPDGRVSLRNWSQGYIAKSPKKTLKTKIVYIVKINYNKNTLLAQCIISQKNNAKVVWDTGEVICDPVFSLKDIHFTARHIKNDPANSKSEISWDKQRQAITLCSGSKRGILKAIVDNMKITIKK